MLTRDEVILQLAQIAVLSPQYYAIAVLLPSLSEVKSFNQQFKARLGEVPVWLKPIVTYDTQKMITLNNGKIFFWCNPLNGRGHSLTTVFKSVMMTEGQTYDYTVSIRPCLCGDSDWIEFKG
jgi:hypothetical protein